MYTHGISVSYICTHTAALKLFVVDKYIENRDNNIFCFKHNNVLGIIHGEFT